MDDQLVSVLMPCFNHQDFVSHAIDSVLKQSYKNIELIIIDDGSTDDTWLNIKKYELIPNVQIIKRENKGLIETIKELRSLAKGIYITVLASDDRFYPHKIEVMVNALQKNPDAAICIGKTDVIDLNNFVIGPVKDEYDGQGDLFRLLLNGETYISSVATMIKRQVYNEVDFFDPYIEDLPAWLQIAKSYYSVEIKDVVASYRITPESLSSNIKRMISSEQNIIEKFLPEGQFKHPVGWACRWFRVCLFNDKYDAIKYLISKQCPGTIFFTLNFYLSLSKFLVKNVLRLA